MCGIAGLLLSANGADRPGVMAREGAAAVSETLARMVGSVRHRGPDDEGREILSGNGCTVALGHTRLTILDLTAAGHQPMADAATGNHITFNGEIYNFQELRRELDDGHTAWSSNSDTEVILRAYARWGRDCVHHLRGMFSFAIWDSQKKQLFLARDRLGIKPLYYYQGDGLFIFASEVRAILASGMIPRRIDPQAVWEYMAYQSVPAPRTLIENVRALSPGSWITVDDRCEVQEKRYWDLLEQAEPEAKFAGIEESRRRVRELLAEAVELHLVSDVPVAAFLSGGIDSSAIVALMSEAGHRPRTFSIVFSEKPYDETEHARRVALRFHTDYMEIMLAERDLLDQMPEVLAAMDQPTGDGVNTYVVSRAVRNAGIKVALSGLGGDEFFGGYPSFARFSRLNGYMRLWKRAPDAMRSLAAKTVRAIGGASVSNVKSAAIVESDGSLASVFPLMRQVLSPAQRRALMIEPWLSIVSHAPDPYVRLLQEAFGEASDAEQLAQISYAEGRTYMHDVLLRDTDQMSMAHALEVRVPLLDHKLVQYVIGLPDTHKRSNGTPKRLLVESLEGLLPEEIVRRPKQGFTLPFDVWLRGSLRGYCEERLAPERTAARKLLHPGEVQKLWADFLAGSPNVSWSRLWVLVVLEEWMEENGVESN